MTVIRVLYNLISYLESICIHNNDNESSFQLTLLSQSMKMNRGFRLDDGNMTVDYAV